MAYSVVDILSTIAFLTANYTADDGAEDADSTSCMTNGTLSETCDEIKEGTIVLKILFTQDESDLIQPIKARFYFDSLMAAGDNVIMPYIDGNSVSNTNEDVEAYTSSGQWINHEDSSGAFRDEMGDASGDGKGGIRFAANDGTAKSKIGEINLDIIIQTFELTATTRDNNGDVLGNCEYLIFKVTSIGPEVWQLKASGTSSGAGAISEFLGAGDYRVVALKDLTNDVIDVTSDKITLS